MKRWLLIVATVLWTAQGFAQSYGNEWIDYESGRLYFKFKVVEEGLYRIDYTTLNFALGSISPSVPISGINPNSFQVFAKGKEQYLHVAGAGDGSFDPGDYIELFCESNDGWLDNRLYEDSTTQTNPNYSLYSDTLTYFLTWDPDGVSSSYRYTVQAYGAPAATPLQYFFLDQCYNFDPPRGGTYHEGRDLEQGKPNTLYDGGKGWMSQRFGYNNTVGTFARNGNFNAPNHYNSGNVPPPTIEMGLAGINLGGGGDSAHHVRLRYGVNGNFTEFDDLIFGSYDYVRYQGTIPISALQDAFSIGVYTAPTGSLINTATDYSALAYVKLRYAHSMTVAGEGLEQLRITMPERNSKNHFNLTGWSSETTSFLYDLGLKQRQEIIQNGTTIKCNINAGPERELFISTDEQVVTIAPSNLVPCGDNGVFSNPLTWQKDSAYLIISHRRLSSALDQYLIYREQTHPGQVVATYIDELYDQFAHGTYFHPWSIRGYCKFAYEQWDTPPMYLFLVGKSIEEARHRNSAANKQACLVPSMGNPASDNYLSMGFGSNPYAPSIATGRISATTNADLNAYRNKISEAELSQNEIPSEYTIAKRQWQKHVLHFAGGSTSGENNQFQSYLGEYAGYLEAGEFGAKRFLFSKTTGNVIEELNADTLRELISTGVSLMCFFGHGTSSGFDISVDDPSRWDNKGRYPVVIANSCFSGNIHLPDAGLNSISEQYVLTPNEGAIAFIASPGLGIPTDLHEYTSKLHYYMGTAAYGASLASLMMRAANDIAPTSSNSVVKLKKISAALEMTLHGDPAFVPYAHARSELSILDPVFGAAVEMQPSVITTDIDSFEVEVTVTNLGKHTKSPVSLTATRNLPNGTAQEVLVASLPAFGYEITYTFQLPVLEPEGIGMNELNIAVDLPNDSIAEFDNFINNSIINFNFDVVDAAITPIFPYDFAVVPSFDLSLKANTGTPFVASRTYRLEIDTTDQYSSPAFQSTNITQSGAVVEWNPGLQNMGFADSTVFFWRATPADDTSKWREYSFQVIEDAHGWGQAHFFQLKNNDIDLMDYNRNVRKLQFSEASRELLVNVVGNPVNDNEYFATKYTLDGQGAPMGEYGVAPNVKPAMAIAVIDTIDLKPWGTYGVFNGKLINEDHQFGNSNNFVQGSSNSRVVRVEYWFSFLVENTTQMDAMVNMISNEVPDGYYILAYSLGKGLFRDTARWKESHIAAFENLGADSIRHVGNEHPYIFFTKKGSPEFTEEVLGYDERDIISLVTKVVSNVKQGEMTTQLIGPSSAWQTFSQKSSALESPDQDSSLAQLLKPNVAATSLAELYETGSIDISHIGVDTVPFVSLRYFTEDHAAGTPAQLNRWHLLYEPAPEAAINPIRGETFLAESVIAGQEWLYGVAVENVSLYDFDTVRMVYQLRDPGGGVLYETEVIYPSLEAGAWKFDSVTLETSGLSGRYNLYVEFNPQDERWHHEQYHFNNVAIRSVTIKADRTNPILDVTFDGEHILNGDIVSPTPTIAMELKDENQFLLLEDTTSFDVYLKRPDGSEARIPFTPGSEDYLIFEPASSEENKANVTFEPSLLEDGTYELRVNARDASGNASGKTAYRITFEVINESTITAVMNYPNPFSTSTRFVFTLTGQRIPDVFTIQILTVTGKVVREITKGELGDLRIGRNITEYAWDGRDEYGDLLGNGLYLYRVITKIDGEAIEARASGADEYFRQSFGKMYLFR